MLCFWDEIRRWRSSSCWKSVSSPVLGEEGRGAALLPVPNLNEPEPRSKQRHSKHYETRKILWNLIKTSVHEVMFGSRSGRLIILNHSISSQSTSFRSSHTFTWPAESDEWACGLEAFEKSQGSCEQATSTVHLLLQGVLRVPRKGVRGRLLSQWYHLDTSLPSRGPSTDFLRRRRRDPLWQWQWPLGISFTEEGAWVHVLGHESLSPKMS